MGTKLDPNLLEYLKGMEQRLSSQIQACPAPKATCQKVEAAFNKKTVIIQDLPEVKKCETDKEVHDQSFKNILQKLKLPESFDYDVAYRLGKWDPIKIRPFMIKFVPFAISRS